MVDLAITGRYDRGMTSSISRERLRRASIALTVGLSLTLTLTACKPAGPDPFVLACEDKGGTILSDSKTSTDTVIVPNSNGPGVGVSTSTTTVVMCIVDGDIVDMEVR